ncbi:hypothetical protein DM02DRAFT_438143 [Periconia macrospinosa]|uniref:Uncharacterized protein n=1 Tax=Periconia macrospinosa TaxID=97972 RepID=A0A2V1DMG9_9PLEO|nr:hypothetical protein DM02DRAFT_438143 [Periconia macrospinosa]
MAKYISCDHTHRAPYKYLDNPAISPQKAKSRCRSMHVLKHHHRHQPTSIWQATQTRAQPQIPEPHQSHRTQYYTVLEYVPHRR